MPMRLSDINAKSYMTALRKLNFAFLYFNLVKTASKLMLTLFQNPKCTNPTKFNPYKKSVYASDTVYFQRF